MKTRARSLLCVLALSALIASGCSDSGGGDGDAGQSVEFGASKEDYQAAFKDVDPITLVAQTAGPKGSFSSKKEEDYAAALEDWSGGKITVDLSYAQAIAPAGEEDDALDDGRLDLAMVTAQIEPDKFPVNSLLLAATMLLRDGFPITGPLQGMSFMEDLGFNTPEFVAEFEKAGMHVLLPFNVGASMIFCSSKRNTEASLDGAVAAANSTAISANLKALGMTPTSLAYTEIFEALQRGVIDCSVSSVAQAGVSGLADPAPYAMYSTEGSMGSGAQTYAVGKRTWDALPLVAKQLMFDRMDVLYQSFLTTYWETASNTITQIKKNGGGVFPLDEVSSAALTKRNQEAVSSWSKTKLVSDPDGLVTRATQGADDWLKRIEGLGLDTTVTYEELPEWWAKNKDSIDLSTFTSALFDDALLDFRPK